MKVKIDNIIINGNRRKVDEEKVKTLAESVNEIGLLNPITINARYELIAGLHRLEAHKQLGIDEIDAIILDLDDLHTELAEIDENLIRNELSPAEISVSIAKRKRIYEELYPETKFGSSEIQSKRRKEPDAESASGETDSFVDDTSKKTGMSTRTISDYQQIGTTIPEDVLSQVDKDTTKQTLIEIAREVKQATREKDKGIRELEKEYREVTKDDTMLLLEEEKRRADELERKLKEERKLREQIAKQEAERLLREKEEEKRRKKEEKRIDINNNLKFMIANETLKTFENFKNIPFQDYLPTLEDESIDLFLIDPPYGMDFKSGWNNQRKIDGDKIDDTILLLDECFKMVYPKLKADSHIYIFGNKKQVCKVQPIIESNFELKDILFWDRQIIGMGDLNSYGNSIDIIYFCYKTIFKSLNGERPRDLLSFQRVSPDKLKHPTEKPIDLLRFIIEKSSCIGGNVLDCFAGGGATLIASKMLKRNFYGCELKEEYYNIAIGRLNNVE